MAGGDQHRPAWSRGESVWRPSPLLQKAGLGGIDPEWAWGGSTGRGVRVAVIDSGVDADHPDLEGCVEADGGIAIRLGARGEIVETPGPHEDLFGHGNACAGAIHTIAPDAGIVSVRVLNARLGGKSPVFLRGLAWAIEQGFDVINLSLGTASRDWALPFYELCDEAYYRGAVLVTAANNIARPSYPSLYASVLSVACNASDDPREFHLNPEPPTEFLARGIDVELPWRAGGRVRITGNSFAAPHIAGFAALVRSKHPGLSPMQVRAVLAACASNVQRMAASPSAPGAAARPRPRGATAVHSLADLMKRYPELAGPAPDSPQPSG